MPEHSHVRHTGPGECEECGMKLVPVKLKKT
ncbi:MAG: heavy metal-binding domain-containing protein [Fidelibacterota bacterium]